MMMRRIATILLFIFIDAFAQAAIISTAAGTSFSSSANVSTFTLNRPSAVNVGDLLFVQITLGASVTVSAANNSGWTLLDDDNNSGTRQVLFYKFATSTDTANGATTWSLSTATTVAASMTGYRSDLGGRNVVLGASTSTTGQSATMTAPAMTATAPGRLLRFFGHRSTSTLSSSTLTTHVNVSSSPVSLLAASRAIAGSGTTTTDTVTASSSARFVIHSVLLTESTLTKPTTCYGDSFSNSTTFGQNWVTTSVGSTAFTPTITSGRLRLTSNTGYISTAATLQRLFPTSNLIYVEFDYYSYPSANGADGVAVTLSDASITPQPGGFGGSLGYAQRDGTINGFAGGWVGIALDEYGNYSNPTEGRNGGPGFRVDSVAIRGSGSGQTGYPYVAGTAANLNPGVDSGTTSAGPGHRYRIVIDAAAPGQTYVTVDRDTTGTGNSYANLIPTFNIESSSGQATIPANLMLSFTGSTGGSSNTHEIGDLSVCATTINTTNQVDHFEITHDGQGLTCEPENVTIRACANASCSTLMSVPVDITLNSSSAWVGGNTRTIPANTPLVVQLRQLTASTIPIAITNSTPGTKPFGTNKCNGVNNNICNLPFADTGLVFDVPNLLANKPSGNVRLRAVRTDTQTNACTSLIPSGSTQNFDFWFNYTNPTASAAAPVRFLEVRSVTPSGNFRNLGTTANSPAPVSIPLTFQTDGISGDVYANFETRYNDAGQLMLYARYTDPTPNTGVVLSGSDSFVSTPAGFCVRTPDPLDSNNSLTCTANYPGCAVFRNAGNNFPLIISAVGWENDGDNNFCLNNPTTPSYVQANISLKSRVVAPVATDPNNNINGTATPSTFNISTGGTVTLNNATESEVGVFEFIATPPQNQYLGVAMPSGNNTNLPIGRFIPHHFRISSGSSLINRAASCAAAPAFTYLGEILNLDYQLSALNASNVVTQNYEGAFARLFNFNNMNFVAIAGSPRTALAVSSSLATPANLNPVILPSWNKGEGSVDTPVFIAKPLTPVGPYVNTAFGVTPTDSDSVPTTSLVNTVTGVESGPNLDTTVPAVTPIVYESFQIGNTTELRYGRLRLDSVSGPANLPLAIPITAEYWNGAAFITNTADSNCTTISINNGTTTLANFSGNLNSGETNYSTANGVIATGKAPTQLLQLGAPGEGNEGSVGVTLNTSPWPWLQFDWNGDGLFDNSTTATASFGTYRGSDRVIYWQEQ